MDASKLVDLIFNHHAVWRDRSPTEQNTLSAGNQIKNIKTRFYLTFKILTKRRTGRTRRTFKRTFGLNRCWWRMLETKCVGIVFPSPTSFIFLHVSNIQNMSSTLNFCHQYPEIFTDFKLATSRCHQHHDVTNITMLPTPLSPLNNIVFGDASGRQNVLVTSLRCWSPFWNIDKNHERKKLTT